MSHLKIYYLHPLGLCSAKKFATVSGSREDREQIWSETILKIIISLSNGAQYVGLKVAVSDL